MPYRLRGNCVVRADTGETVKCHPTREKARRHLVALKINVEHKEMSMSDENVGEKTKKLLLKLGRVVVPPYVKVQDGKTVHVDGYTYERKGAKNMTRDEALARTREAAGQKKFRAPESSRDSTVVRGIPPTPPFGGVRREDAVRKAGAVDISALIAAAAKKYGVASAGGRFDTASPEGERADAFMQGAKIVATKNMSDASESMLASEIEKLFGGTYRRDDFAFDESSPEGERAQAAFEGALKAQSELAKRRK